MRTPTAAHPMALRGGRARGTCMHMHSHLCMHMHTHGCPPHGPTRRARSRYVHACVHAYAIYAMCTSHAHAMCTIISTCNMHMQHAHAPCTCTMHMHYAHAPCTCTRPHACAWMDRCACMQVYACIASMHAHARMHCPNHAHAYMHARVHTHTHACMRAFADYTWRRRWRALCMTRDGDR